MINQRDLQLLQENLIKSHACGVGETLSLNLTRRIMVLRINTLLKGCSGVSLTTFDALVQLFNSGLVPFVTDRGTVGASGDLVPLAHIALALIAEGRVWCPRRRH